MTQTIKLMTEGRVGDSKIDPCFPRLSHTSNFKIAIVCQAHGNIWSAFGPVGMGLVSWRLTTVK